MTCPHCHEAIAWGVDRRAWTEDGQGHHSCNFLFGELITEAMLNIRESDMAQERDGQSMSVSQTSAGNGIGSSGSPSPAAAPSQPTARGVDVPRLKGA
jgi:hypothetical protein